MGTNGLFTGWTLHGGVKWALKGFQWSWRAPVGPLTWSVDYGGVPKILEGVPVTPKWVSVVTELLPGDYEGLLMVTEVFQEVLELWRSFVPLTPKMFPFLLPMFLEDVLLTLEGLWLGFERVKQVLKKPHRPHIGVSVVFEGIPSIISNNLTDLSKSVCGPIFLKHDRLCYIIINALGERGSWDSSPHTRLLDV